MSIGITVGFERPLLVAAAVIAIIAGAWALSGEDARAQAMGPVVSLSVGGDHACALTGGGQILCWGRNDQGQATPPETLVPYDSYSNSRPEHAFEAKVLDLGESYSCGVSRSDYEQLPDYWGDQGVSLFGGAAGDRKIP